MPKLGKQTEDIHIRIEPDLRVKALDKAKKEGKTLSQVIRLLLLKWLKSE